MVYSNSRFPLALHSQGSLFIEFARCIRELRAADRRPEVIPDDRPAPVIALKSIQREC